MIRETGLNPEQIKREKIEAAKEILGEENFFGPEDIAKTFGFEEGEIEVPSIPYSAQELKEARENGETLMLRIDKTPNDEPLTIEKLIELTNGVFAEDSSEIKDNTKWIEDAKEVDVGFDFLTENTPNLEWKLINTNKVKGTEHLSIKAQKAIVNKNIEKAQKQKENTLKFWGEEANIERREELMPDNNEIREIIREIPNNASLPTLIEAIYDNLIHYQKTEEPLIEEDRIIATSSTINEINQQDSLNIKEPERPWDLYFTENGKVKIHTRRDMNMGRPGPLGDNEPGVAISYIQH